MANRFSMNTAHTLIGQYDADVDDDLRVIQQIELSAQKKRAELDALQERWYKRTEKLSKRGNYKITPGYDWRGVFC